MPQLGIGVEQRVVLHRLDPARILDELVHPRGVAAADSLAERRANLADLESGLAGGRGESRFAPSPTVAAGPPNPPSWNATPITTETG